MIKFSLPKVYPITDTEISRLSHADQVKFLIDGGATIIQLREKKSSPRTFFHDAVAAVRLAKESGVKIIINDRVDIALATGADGVHLGQTDMPVGAARRLMGPDLLIGFSTHNVDQATTALALPIDYLAFGPVHGTKTKENADPTTGLEQLRQVHLLKGPLPLVAIGGIDASNARPTIDAGADSVAVISAVISNPTQIPEKLEDLLQLLA